MAESLPNDGHGLFHGTIPATAWKDRVKPTPQTSQHNL
jgi:hypothetical protein